MLISNFTRRGTQAKTFEELTCSPSLVGGLRQESLSFAAVNILLSITAFVGNSLILIALHKESSLHPPSKLLYRCLATTDLLVGLVGQPLAASSWMFSAHEHWIPCRYASTATFITSYVLCGVSLLTMTAISVDRLLAILLQLKYKQIVTLKRTYIIVVTFWVQSIVAALCYTLDYRVFFWYGLIVVPLCYVTSIVSYTKIFCALSHHRAQIRDYVTQPSQPNAVNTTQCKKAVYNALWVQLALVVCYLPYALVEIVISRTTTDPSHLVIMRDAASILAFFNSTLNPFLYCWKISEVRQAVKRTIRQAFSRP